MQVMRRRTTPDTRTPAQREADQKHIRDLLIAMGGVEVKDPRTR